MVGLTCKSLGLESLDIFNNLALNPYTEPITSVSSMARQMRKVFFALHPDRLLGKPAPPNTDLARISDLVDRMKEADASEQRLYLASINENGRDGWNSTWHLGNTIGIWSPLPAQGTNTPRPPSTPSSQPPPPQTPQDASSGQCRPPPTPTPNPFASSPPPPHLFRERACRPYYSSNNSPSSPPPASGSSERARRPYSSSGNSRYNTTPLGREGFWEGTTPGQRDESSSARAGRRQENKTSRTGEKPRAKETPGSSYESALPVSDGEDEAGNNDPIEMLRCQHERFWRHLGPPDTFRYRLSLAELRTLGRAVKRDAGTTAVIAIGVVCTNGVAQISWLALQWVRLRI